MDIEFQLKFSKFNIFFNFSEVDGRNGSQTILKTPQSCREYS